MIKKIKVRASLAAQDVVISTDFIRLDALLKFCGAVKSGGEAKTLIQDGMVSVDGEVCLMRGKKLRDGQRVKINDTIYRVVYNG